MARPKSGKTRSTRKVSRRSEHRPVTEASWWDRQSGAVQHGICLLALLVVAFGFFSPIVFSAQSLIGGDTINWRAMAEAMIEYRQETGEPALWAPNAFAGMPGYMISYPEQIPQLDDIPKLLNPLVWPAGHFFLMLAGVYLLVVLLSRQKWAGVLSAVAFGLTTYIPVILVAGHNSKFYALAYAPWLVLAFAYALRRPRLLSGLLFAVALAVNLRAGHVQITYYVAILLGIWWIVELVGALRRRTLKPFGFATAWLALGAMLAVLMVAQPYLPNAEYRQYTIRGSAPGEADGALRWDYAMSWSQGWGEFATLLVADAYGGGGRTYWGPKPFTAGPHYVGGIVLLLAIVALWRLRRNVVYALGIATILMMLFATGEFFPWLNRLMFEYFPLFSSFRVPETWLAIVSLTLAVLAGLGVWYLSHGDETTSDDARRVTTTAYAATGGMIALVLILMLGRDALFAFEQPNEYDTLIQQVAQQRPDLSPSDPQVQQFVRQEIAERREERREMFSSDAVRTLIFLILAGAAILATRRGRIPGWTLQLALAVLVLIDLWGVDRRYLNADVLVPADKAEELVPTYGFDRYLLDRREEVGGRGHFRVLSLEASPMTNARPSYYHESIGGYHGAKLRLYQDYIDNIFFDPESGRFNLEAVDMLNVRYVVAGGPPPGMRPVHRDEQTGLTVFENPNATPRGYFVEETEGVADEEEMWQRLREGDFDLMQTALLSEPLDVQQAPMDEGSTSVALESYSLHEIRWAVSTDVPRLFVASEIYYPAGWRAFLGDEEVPIHRVNYLLRGVVVPEGEHTLTMRFEPRTHRISVWVTGLATLFTYGSVFLLLVVPLARRRTRSGDAS
ncbi:MAG: hypothetical protein ACOCTG_00790 [Bacteroidota bacterium]